MRVNLKRTPQCCALEGRQLLNAAWGGHAKSDGAAGTGKPPAMIHHLAKGDGDHLAPDRSAGGHFGQHSAPSAAAQADMQTLQTDMQTLQSEIPASITAAVTADQATIKTALGSLTAAQRQSLFPAPTASTSSTPLTPPTPSTTQLTALLTAANIPSSQITTIESDFAAYQNALTTTDPTLQAKITADKAALAAAMPGAPADAPDIPAGAMAMMGGPGGPGFGPGFGPGMT
jgi:hypothetical protein